MHSTNVMKLFPVVVQASLYSLIENKCLIYEAYNYIQDSWRKCRKLIFNYTWWYVTLVICDVIFWCLPTAFETEQLWLIFSVKACTTHFNLNFSLFLNPVVTLDFPTISFVHAFIQVVASTWNSLPILISICEAYNGQLLFLTTQPPFLPFCILGNHSGQSSVLLNLSLVAWNLSWTPKVGVWSRPGQTEPPLYILLDWAEVRHSLFAGVMELVTNRA